MTPKQQNILYHEFGYNYGINDLSGKEAYKLIGSLTEQRVSHNKEIADKARAASLYDLASRYTSWCYDTFQYAHARCPISGCKSTRDAFYVNKTSNVGGCTQCNWHLEGEGAGPIGFVCAIEKCNWKEAAELITNNQYTPATQIMKPEKRSPYPHEAWQTNMERALKVAQRRFLGSDAHQYIEHRRVNLKVAQQFGCGAGTMKDGPHRGQPCLVLPYYKDGQLVAINRRVCAPVKRDKYRFVAGSRKTGYFSYYLGNKSEDHQIWVVEGELNAMSIAQILMELNLDGSVMSVSSEVDIKRVAPEIAKEHPRATVWIDKESLAREIYGKHNLRTVWSRRGDANDLLQQQELCVWMKNHLRYTRR